MVTLKKYGFLMLILVAILVGYVSANTIGLTFLLTGLIFSISLVLVTFLGLIFSKVSEKHQQITAFIFSFFIIALITSFFTKIGEEGLATKQADEIIVKIYQYKSEKGVFPTSIEILAIDAILKKKFDSHNYQVDSSKKQFSLRAYACYDGWSTKTFYSENKEWRIED